MVKTYLGYGFFLLLSYSAGVFGAQFEPGYWYEQIQKPAWTPPDVVFPVVWPILYTLMGIAAGMVWNKHGRQNAKAGLLLFCFQLVLNAAWSWLFFGLHLTGTAAFELLMLWITVLATMIAFYRKAPAAGWLMAPYLLWLTYALALNAAIWLLNRSPV